MSRRLHVVEQPLKRTWAFSRIEDAIAAMRAGQMVFVVDDEDRENEGEPTIASRHVSKQPKWEIGPSPLAAVKGPINVFWRL